MKIKKLKNRIILYFIFVTIIPSMFITFFYYYNTSNIYEENILKTAVNDLDYIKNNVEERITMANKFTDWFYLNSNFNQILTNNNTKTSSEDLEVYKQINLHLNNSPLENYVASLIIVGNNGKEFKLAADGSMIEVEEIKSQNWFESGMNVNNSVFWPGLIDNPALISNYENVIPVIRPIFHETSYKKIGWVFVAFKESLITDIYNDSNDSEIKEYYTIDHNQKILASDQENIFLNNQQFQSKVNNIMNQDQGYFRIGNNGVETLYVFQELSQNNWSVVEVLPMTVLAEQNRVLTYTSLMIFLVSLILTTLLIIYLSNNLTEPLKKIVRQVNQISLGVFDQNKHIEGQDELGILGSKINTMAESIKILMNKIKDEEEEKRRFELKALQNQINPHFLYNTLNSIKWMAAVHGAVSIKKMVVALGRLLRNLSADTNKEITLAEELEILDDYVYIQEIRYSGRIKFKKDIKDPELLKSKIIKFILQPLVENAIFHGIEAKEEADLIKVEITRIENTKNCDLLQIKVYDNGIGMTREQITELLNEKKKIEHKHDLNGIGLQNVQQRIKMNYGAEYGLKINSAAGEFTEVVVILPINF
ncbi:two-component system sensor histidine kinase YesM [Halanaerobium saccharolyticum]|uniref:Two-component system sensor histidine kinase YesM n=1 Tax=Halanaerobium saccharolyticum TaxID=43595 RepID=A0A4R7YN50_9FIRM|nr:sensor histidine kinase [Halanaerobium saccharolyticum]RAK05169.1 two-component system sensor histidine kinase YesM [Halanaerobium saccharolyticum]TDV99000.1 two-component system sensor histidine kinase YesM [Halanaerobium saccharolyticum]TDX51691.1 two-component system sensor histidine kinase YesM [Halanaerobium saccharolyticum]